MARTDKLKQGGSIIVTILIVMTFMVTLLLSLLVLANANLYRARGRVMLLQAQYSAESGADTAIAELNGGSSSYAGTSGEVTVLTTSQYKSTYTTSVADGSDSKQKIITATGYVYVPATATSPTYTRKIRVTAERTSTTAASSLMSRNIIDVDSSVKSIHAKDIYMNGYINLRSNASTLYFESMRVAGRDTGAADCSVEGSGHLAKASTLSSTQQATIDVAYNNCITPPGNTSNTDFSVTAHDSTVTQITSMYIPWSQYMDSSYLDGSNGCADWLAASPVSIPSTGNTKKTQYPDSGSGISSSCGTNGNLDLGAKTFDITDNAHIRANLCAGTGCSPTFDNTSGSLKFIFVEGNIDFNSLHTTPGSAPIVFVAYGADPNTHNKCTLGDSIFLGNDGSTGTDAPAAYLLSMNGICLYQTKFAANPALGGIGGKNIYVSTNSGTPFDLYLDPDFPTSSIPVDLAWREVGYERL